MKANTKKKIKYGLLGMAAVLILLTVGGLAYLQWGGTLSARNSPPADDSWIQSQNRVNILLLGSDDALTTNTRTDTIILASLDTVTKRVSLLSIPRDTRVDIPGHGPDKINAANQLGGVQLTKETLSNLLKVPIDYYILTNFDGFRGIIDILGGVEIDVEQEMHYQTYDGTIDLNKGLQRLDGEKALQYVRFRHDKLGDISRTQRQQKFLAALAREMAQPQNIVKLPFLLPQLMKTVETDLSMAQLAGLARQADQFDMANLNTQTLPGNFATIKGGSYWVVDMEKTPQVVMEIFAGESKELIDTDISPQEPGPKKNESQTSSQPKNDPVSVTEDTQPVEVPVIVDDKAEVIIVPIEDGSMTDEPLDPVPPETPSGEGDTSQGGGTEAINPEDPLPPAADDTP